MDDPGRGDTDDGGGGFRNEAEARKRLRNQIGQERYNRVSDSLWPSGSRPLAAEESAILRETVGPLLRDLEAAGLRLPDIREEVRYGCDPAQVCAWIEEVDGGGSGIVILKELPAPERVALLAEQIQNWAADQLHDASLYPEWPVCPIHPAAGRAHPEVRDAAAVWVCSQARHPISAIGSLPRSETGG